MNSSIQLAVTETLDFLQELQRDSVRPGEAQVRLQNLRERHPELALNLLSEIEAYDQSVHYDALLRCHDAGTVSISYCPERITPWPLLGVHRWSDADLLRVNTYVLKVDEAIAFLDFVWEEAPIANQLINQCVIREELVRQPIELSDAELQAEVDQFRVSKQLFKTEDMLRWLDANGMTQANLERFVADNCLIRKLCDRVTQPHVEEYFRQHASDFDTAHVARIQVADEGKADELANAIRSGAIDFYTAAESRFLGAKDANVSRTSLFAIIERGQIEPAISEVVFGSASGHLVGPVAIGAGFELWRVLSTTTACLDEQRRETIKQILFEQWLAERRHAAQVEWCWGNASKTDSSR